MATGLTCKFWGVRGSIPAPINGPEYRRRLEEALLEARRLWTEKPELRPAQMLAELNPSFTTLVGGETTCIEIRFGDAQLIVDLGTGARRLGYDMMVRKQPEAIHILLTHSHWDHVQGWPFFIPGYLPTSTLHFHSIFPDMESRFEKQQREFFFPVEFQTMASTRQFHHHAADSSFSVGPFEIQVAQLPHPGGVAAYRIAAEGRSLVVAPDCDISDTGRIDPALLAFFEGADVMVLDGFASLDEAEQGGAGGHGSGPAAARLAASARVPRLVLTHHAPFRIEREFGGLQAEAAAEANGIDIHLAREGDELLV